MLDDPKIGDYLEDLYKQVNEDVISDIYFLQHVAGGTMNDPQIVRDVADRTSELGAAKLQLADRHLGGLSQQFVGFLKLTDFWK